MIAAPTAAAVTPEPSPTVEAKKAVLLALEGNDPGLTSTVQAELSELAAGSGLSFVTTSELTQLELDPDVRILAAVPPDPGIANLAAANPRVQFLAVGLEGIQPGQNLSVLETGAGSPDQQGFLAGYLAALITPDWRVGVIGRGDSIPGKSARLGFINGSIFFCGLCRPIYPPFVQYPFSVEMTGTPGQAEQQAAADQLIANGVKTVYIDPSLSDNFLLEYLAQAGVVLIGSEMPDVGLQSNWAASIQVDLASAIQTVWPKLLNGEGGSVVTAPIALTDVNPALLSTGRQRLVEQTLADLLAGAIDTGVDPQTGDRAMIQHRKARLSLSSQVNRPVSWAAISGAW